MDSSLSPFLTLTPSVCGLEDSVTDSASADVCRAVLALLRSETNNHKLWVLCRLVTKERERSRQGNHNYQYLVVPLLGGYETVGSIRACTSWGDPQLYLGGHT